MAHPSSIRDRILLHAAQDAIDLTVLPFLEEALESIAEISEEAKRPIPSFVDASRIDTHTHPVPSWFRDLQPLAAGRETPKWDIGSHLEFMATHNISHSILCPSTPQANAFLGDKGKTVALARLLNEFVAAVSRAFPERFSWFAVTTLPYVEESVREVKYALEELGAAGVGVLTNHEGLYPGENTFDPFWEYLQGTQFERVIVFIHPTDPVLRSDPGTFINANPSTLRAGLGEFYFETARAISSITANRTIFKYPKLHWRISHGAGAFPDIAERFLLGFPEDANEARRAYATRFWYDSAGPVYPRQIQGLLAHGVPSTQLVFGTDYPYGIGFWNIEDNIHGIQRADFLSPEEKEAIFHGNSEALWSGHPLRHG